MNVNELIIKIKNGEHIISKEDLINYPELRKDFDVMKKAIDVNCNYVRYAEIRCYRRNDIGQYAIEKGFIPIHSDISDNRYLRISESLRKLYESNLNELEFKIKHKEHTITKEDLINYIELRNDFEIMKLAIQIDCNLVAYIRDLTREEKEQLGLRALELGYIPKKEDFILSGNTVFGDNILGKIDAIMVEAIKIDPRLVGYNIKYIDYAFECGLQIDKKLLEEFPNLLYNDKIFKLALKIDPNYMEYGYLAKEEKPILESFRNSTLSVDNLNYAISKGYIPTIELVSKISSKNQRIKEKGNINEIINELLTICIDRNPNSIMGYNREIDEKIIKYAISKGFVPKLEEIKEHLYLKDSYTIGNYLLEQNEEWKNNKFIKYYIEKYTSKTLSIDIIDKIWPFISNEEIYNIFSFEEILNFVQYLYLSFYKATNFRGEYTGVDKSNYSNLKENIEEIIKQGDLRKFALLVNLLSNNGMFKDKMEIMNQISSNFIKYKNLINDLFTQESITRKSIYLIKQILLSKEQININSISELDNYSLMMYKKRSKEISNIDEIDEYEAYYWDDELDDSVFLILYRDMFGDMEAGENEGFLLLQDQILKMLCNISLKGYLENINHDFNSKCIDKLIRVCKNEVEKEKLENYKAIIEFIESILKCRNFETLKNIANKLNEQIYKNSEYILSIYESFNELIAEKRTFFGNELSGNLISIDGLISREYSEGGQKKFLYTRNKFNASDKELYDENISGKTVDYIELQGESFVFLTHVLNAYGDGAELQDFKYPRLLGKPHICLSTIGDSCLKMASSKIDKLLGGTVQDDYTENYTSERINYVTLLFDNFEKEQLALMSYGDIGSYSIENSVKVDSYILPTFLTTKELLDSTNNISYYNECVLYRRDENGNYIYPSAIITRNQQPTQYEIDAAAYLEIPIVYINQKYYLNNEKKDQQVLENAVTKEVKIKEELKKLRDLLEMESTNSKSKGM